LLGSFLCGPRFWRQEDNFLKAFVCDKFVNDLEVAKRVKGLHLAIRITHVLEEKVLEGDLHEALGRVVRSQVLVHYQQLN